VVTGVAVFFFAKAQLPADDPSLDHSLSTVAASFRRFTVLMDGSDSLSAAERGTLPRCRPPDFLCETARIDGYIHGLRDADKLAFLDLLDELDALPGGPKGLGDGYPMSGFCASERLGSRSCRASTMV
jgi:hypothetical protein